MNPLKTVYLGAAFVAVTLAAAVPASATTYDFSYTFDTGDVVSGSFQGTGPLSDVTNLSNISASFDGTPFVGSPNLYAYHYTAPGTDCPTCWQIGGAEVSSNPLDNNFLFIDTPTLSGFQNYFYIIPWPNGVGNPEATQYFSAPDTYVDLYNGQFIPANWSLSAVPEPLTLSIFGAGLAGAAALRRRKKKA